MGYVAPSSEVSRQGGGAGLSLVPISTTSVPFRVILDASNGGKLGMDLQYIAGSSMIPITGVTAGLSAEWNHAHPETKLVSGDQIIAVNSIGGDATLMMLQLKSKRALEILVVRPDGITSDADECIFCNYKRRTGQ